MRKSKFNTKLVFGVALLSSTLISTSVWAGNNNSSSSNNHAEIKLLIKGNDSISTSTDKNGDTVVTLPNSTKVVVGNGTPYCVAGCDVPIDCKGNKPAAPSGQQWACHNAPGACVGTCYLESSS